MKNPEDIVKVNTKDLENLLYFLNLEKINKINVTEIIKIINNPAHNYFAKRYLYFYLMAACSNSVVFFHNNNRDKKNYLNSEEFYKDMERFQKNYIYTWEDFKNEMSHSLNQMIDSPFNIYNNSLLTEVTNTLLNFNEDLYEEYEQYFNEMFQELKESTEGRDLFRGVRQNLKFILTVNSRINAINYMNVYLKKNSISKNSVEYNEVINGTKEIIKNFSKLDIEMPYINGNSYQKKLKYNNYFLLQLYFVMKAYLIVHYNYPVNDAENFTNTIIEAISKVNDSSPIFLKLHVNAYEWLDKITNNNNMPLEWSIELMLEPIELL